MSKLQSEIRPAPPTGAELVRGFSELTDGCFLNVLDPSELLSLAQNADRVAKKSKRVNRVMGFDFVLFQRWKKGMMTDTAHFRYQVKFE